MKTKNFELVIYRGAPIGGLKAQYPVPATLDDAIDGIVDKLPGEAPRREKVAKAKQVILDTFVKDVIYHKVLGSLRGELTETIIEKSKGEDGKPTIDLLTEKKTVGDKERDVIVEDDEPFARRALVEGKTTTTDMQATFQELASHADNEFLVYATTEGRVRAPKTAPKTALAQVDKWQVEGKLERAMLKFAGELGVAVPDFTDKNACALLFWSWQTKKLAESVSAV